MGHASFVTYNISALIKAKIPYAQAVSLFHSLDVDPVSAAII